MGPEAKKGYTPNILNIALQKKYGLYENHSKIIAHCTLHCKHGSTSSKHYAYDFVLPCVVARSPWCHIIKNKNPICRAAVLH